MIKIKNEYIKSLDSRDINETFPRLDFNVNKKKASAMIDIYNDKLNKDKIKKDYNTEANLDNKHIYILRKPKLGPIGVVLAQEGGNTPGTNFIRIDRDYNEIEFNPDHCSWAFHPVTTNAGEFIEVPISWVKTEVLTEGPFAGKTCWWISDKKVPGLHVHPVFLYRDNKAYPLRYSKYFISKNSNGKIQSKNCNNNKANDGTQYLYNYKPNGPIDMSQLPN